MEKHHPEDQLEEELAPEEKLKDATPSAGGPQAADRDHADGLNANSPAGGSQTDHGDTQPEGAAPEPGTYSGR